MTQTSPQSPPVTTTAPGKSSILLIAALLSCFIVAYAPIIKSLVHTWVTSDDYSYGFFILPISLYIVWQKKEELSRIEIRPSKWGLVLFILSLVIYFPAYLAGIQTVSSVTIIPLWGGIILYLFGFQMLRAVIFPLLFLLFMIPVPSQIYSSLTIPLQLIVSKISVTLTSGLGVPIYAEGNVLHLPERTLEVVAACSGLRSLLSLFVLSLVFGYFSLRSNLLRSILFISAVPVAILVNIVRVSLIVLVFYYYNFDLSSGAIHTWLGLGIFLLALACIFIEKRILGIWDH